MERKMKKKGGKVESSHRKGGDAIAGYQVYPEVEGQGLSVAHLQPFWNWQGHLIKVFTFEEPGSLPLGREQINIVADFNYL